MTRFVRLEHHGDVGVIIVDNPPVNALSVAVREGLVKAIRELATTPALRCARALANTGDLPRLRGDGAGHADRRGAAPRMDGVPGIACRSASGEPIPVPASD